MKRFIDYLYFLGYCLYGIYYFNHPRFRGKEEKMELVEKYVAKYAIYIPLVMIIFALVSILIPLYFLNFQYSKLGLGAFVIPPCILVYVLLRKRFMSPTNLFAVKMKYNQLQENEIKKNKYKAILIVGLSLVLYVSALIRIALYFSSIK